MLLPPAKVSFPPSPYFLFLSQTIENNKEEQERTPKEFGEEKSALAVRASQDVH